MHEPGRAEFHFPVDDLPQCSLFFLILSQKNTQKSIESQSGNHWHLQNNLEANVSQGIQLTDTEAVTDN